MHVEADRRLLDLDPMKDPVPTRLVANARDECLEIRSGGEEVEVVRMVGAPEITGSDLAVRVGAKIGLLAGALHMDLPDRIAPATDDLWQAAQLHLGHLAGRFQPS